MNAKKILAMFALVLTIVALLASCKPSNQVEEHEHEYTIYTMTKLPGENDPGDRAPFRYW